MSRRVDTMDGTRDGQRLGTKRGGFRGLMRYLAYTLTRRDVRAYVEEGIPLTRLNRHARTSQLRRPFND